jgi:hypothetical protein
VFGPFYNPGAEHMHIVEAGMNNQARVKVFEPVGGVGSQVFRSDYANCK